MCVYSTYTQIDGHRCTHICICKHACTYITLTCIHAHTCKSLYMCICAYIHMCLCRCLCVCVCVYIGVYMHIYILTDIHVHTRMETHIYVSVCVCVCACERMPVYMGKAQAFCKRGFSVQNWSRHQTTQPPKEKQALMSEVGRRPKHLYSKQR